MDSTLGSSFNNNSCNESSLFNSTPRCTLFSSISESFTIPASDSPVEPNLPSKAATSTPSFANDSYSDIIKARPSKTYTCVEYPSPSDPSPSSLMRTPSCLTVLQPRKPSPLVPLALSSLQTAVASSLREVPTVSSTRTVSSSSSVSSLNSDDDTFFEQLTTLQNTIENSLPSSRASPGPKISDFESLLTGEIRSHRPPSESNSPLKDPYNQCCVSRAKQDDSGEPGNPTHPLSQTNGQRPDEERERELVKGEGVEGDRGKENSPRPPVSAIRPAQIVTQWGGEGKIASKQSQKRVTFASKPREEHKLSLSKCADPTPTPTRPQTRFRKINSAPNLPPSPLDPAPAPDPPTINSKIWCPPACALNPSVPLSPCAVPPKRICRGGSTPEFPSSPASKFVRCQSSPANTSLNSSSGEELLGDNSRTHILPVVKGSNPDLKSIEPETLVRVLTGEFSPHIANLVIVDARYPYEYAGGHVRTALNIWTEELSYQFFLKAPYLPNSELRHIVVFYCEFSTMRGPCQYRYLRNEDRKMNESSFPRLHYPELYVLNGGYARFFSVAADKCDPNSYIPMLHEDHKEELAKSQLLKHKGSKRSSLSSRVTRPTKSKCRRKQKFN